MNLKDYVYSQLHDSDDVNHFGLWAFGEEYEDKNPLELLKA